MLGRLPTVRAERARRVLYPELRTQSLCSRNDSAVGGITGSGVREAAREARDRDAHRLESQLGQRLEIGES